MSAHHLSASVNAGIALRSTRHVPCCAVVKRYLTMSRTARESNAADGEGKGLQETKSTSSNRAKRLEEATRDVRNLFLRSAAAREKSNPGNQGTTFRSISLKRSDDSAPRVQSNRSQPAGGLRITRTPIGQSSGNVVDARSLGATRPDGNAARIVTRRPNMRAGAFTPRNPRGAQTTGRPRARTDGASERRPKRGSRKGGRMTASKEDKREYEQMIKSYEREQKKANAAKPASYSPDNVTKTSIEAFQPAIISDQSGKRNMIAEKKEAAAHYVSHKGWIDSHQIWDSERDKGQTLSVVKSLENAGKKQDDVTAKGNTAGKEPEEAPSADVLNTLFSGAYISARPQLRNRKQDVVTFVGQQVARNASYEHGDEQGLMAKVSSILGPAKPVTKEDARTR